MLSSTPTGITFQNVHMIFTFLEVRYHVLNLKHSVLEKYSYCLKFLYVTGQKQPSVYFIAILCDSAKLNLE